MPLCPSEPRALFYVHDGFGLGNLRRMHALAAAFARRTAARCVLVCGSESCDFFGLTSPRVDRVKLPSLGRDRDGAPTSCLGDIPLVRAMRARILEVLIDQFRPTLVVVDKLPDGAYGELAPLLPLVRRVGAKLALVLRDILDCPQAVQAEWERTGRHDIVREFFDAVIVAGSPEVYDLFAECAFPSSARAKGQYVGYFGYWLEHRDGLMNGPGARLLITVGGGEDGREVAGRCLDAIAGAARLRSFTTRIVCGPRMPAEDRRSLRARARRMPSVTVQSATRRMIDVMKEADAIITMGGYNALCEALSLGRRTIVVPRVAPTQEQSIRAERFERLGWVRKLDLDELGAESLWDRIARPARDRPDRSHFGGLARAAAVLGELSRP